MTEHSRIADTAGDSTHAGTSDDDVFVFAPGNGADTITDFANGSDRIDLSAFPEIRDFDDLSYTSNAEGVTIDLADFGGGTIFLQGFSIDDLDAEDFVFAEWQYGNAWTDITLLDGNTRNYDALGGDDWIKGSDADERIRGGQGRDVIFGGRGDDTLHGGAGADTFVFRYDDGNDTIEDFNPDEDLIDLTSFNGISGFGDLTITAEGDDAVIDLSDAYGGGSIVLKNVPVSALTAANFAFTIVGDDSDDMLTGGDSQDFIFGEGGADTIYGGGGEDYIEGGARADTIYSGAGDDTILGGSGDDTIYGGADDDWLGGESGNDTLHGDEGDDWLAGGSNDDTLYGGADEDTLYGGSGDDTLYGGTERDLLYGEGGDDTLYGGAGDDWLEGGADADTLYGGAGKDRLEGGAGADTFVFEAGHGTDRIADFTAGEDVIDLSAIVGIVDFDDLTITVERGNAVIDLSAHGGGRITLEGVSPSDLNADDFVFYQNVYTGTNAAETLEGGGGDDTITGNAGADTFAFAPGHGNDTITDFTDGEDTIDLSAFAGIASFSDLKPMQDGSDTVIDLSAHGGGTVTLQGVSPGYLDADDFAFYQSARSSTDAAETLEGGGGADAITGLGGDDMLTGNEGADTFVFTLDHGDDTITDFTVNQDKIDLSAFTDIARLKDMMGKQDGSDAVIDLSNHGGGTITLQGVSLSDLDADDFVFYQNVHTGTAAAETLEGGGGDDRITGLGGDDTLTGNEGADSFVFASGHGSDTITDFSGVAGDSIDLTAFTGITGFTDLTKTQDGNDLVIDLTGETGGGTITLQDVDLGELEASYFSFYEVPAEGG